MPERSMNLIDVARQCGDQDLLRQLAEAALAQLMELEVAQRVGAGCHERSEERTTHRNGYRERTLGTRLGTLELEIPTRATAATSPRSWNRAGCPSGPWWR